MEEKKYKGFRFYYLQISTLMIRLKKSPTKNSKSLYISLMAESLRLEGAGWFVKPLYKIGCDVSVERRNK